jgi:hypothetical protein
MRSRVQYLVFLFLTIQAMSIPYLWYVGATGIVSQGEFAIFLSINLLSFSMVAYIYRKDRMEENIEREWMLAGCFTLFVLILSSILLTLM